MNEQEVYFWIWCPKCKHYEDLEVKDPCNFCLDHPMNEDSDKPVKFEEK